jgi:Uma2 family endonuclease
MGDEGKGFELVGGELKEWTVSKESSRIAGRICTRLDVFCESRGVGYVFPEGMSYQCFPTDPTRVRRADTSFIALSRMPSATYRDEGHCTTVPDLVVEVISPNDNAEEVAEKIQDWLGAGVKLVWEVYPGRQTIRANLPDGTATLFRPPDILTAEGVLPGFSCPVADLFRLPTESTPVA